MLGARLADTGKYNDKGRAEPGSRYYEDSQMPVRRTQQKFLGFYTYATKQHEERMEDDIDNQAGLSSPLSQCPQN
jgi:hypothetical protein